FQAEDGIRDRTVTGVQTCALPISVFNSTYKGNDGISRSTDYNGRFATNLLAGYEPKLGPNTVLITGAKVTYAGGKLYSQPDVARSEEHTSELQSPYDLVCRLLLEK